MSRYESSPSPDKVPETKTAFSGGPPQPPPKPPKLTAQDLFDPGGSGPRIFVPDYLEVRELAELLGLKPFKVVATLMELRLFKHADELINFATAANIARKHGFLAERLL